MNADSHYIDVELTLTEEEFYRVLDALASKHDVLNHKQNTLILGDQGYAELRDEKLKVIALWQSLWVQGEKYKLTNGIRVTH